MNASYHARMQNSELRKAKRISPLSKRQMFNEFFQFH